MILRHRQCLTSTYNNLSASSRLAADNLLFGSAANLKDGYEGTHFGWKGNILPGNPEIRNQARYNVN